MKTKKYSLSRVVFSIYVSSTSKQHDHRQPFVFSECFPEIKMTFNLFTPKLRLFSFHFVLLCTFGDNDGENNLSRA